MSDTTPDQLDPSTVEGYEPPAEGETSKERRNRKARNRRRAEKAQADNEQEREPTRKPGPGRPSARGKREQAVMGILTGAGVAVMAFDEFDGTTIIEGAPDLARSLAALADKRPAVARALDSLTETSAWAEVAVALGSIVVPIVRNHAARPPEVDAPADPPADNVSRRRDNTPPPSDPPPQVADDAPVFTVRADDRTDAVPTFRVSTP